VLRKRLGSRFQAYGSGYPKKWLIEPCKFDEQFGVINRSLASFSIDAAKGAPGYFSNRTPFSLACGSVHILIRRTGFDQVFGGCPSLIQVGSAGEAADAFEAIYSWSDSQKLLAAQEGKAFAKKNLRIPDLYRQLIQESMS
jgi:hypothetical protein